MGKGVIGYDADHPETELGKVNYRVEPHDLVRYGLIPEFIGRLPVLASLEELDEAALVQILTEPKNALIKQYTHLFEMEDVKIEFREDAVKAAAKAAVDRKTGARGLRSILEKALLDTMFKLPAMEGVSHVVVDADTITGDKTPLLVMANEEEIRLAVNDDK